MLRYPPHVSLARLPTPLEECPGVSDLLRPGQRLWVKRDDETGCVTSGNKVRKLEFYVADARRVGADTLVTAGSALSNHCRTTAVVARQVGLEAALLLRRPERPALDGNFLLMALTDAIIRTLPPEAPGPTDDYLEDLAEALRAQGRKPYVIPTGGSGPLGVTAYVRAAEELKEQCDEIGLRPDAVTITYGSGSTYAGLLLGSRLSGLECPIVAMSISPTADVCAQHTRELIDATIPLLGAAPCVSDADIVALDGYRGEGYGIAAPELYDFIHDIARRTGLILDPVYTGKALWGTLEEMRSGSLREAQNVVFIHTGGVFGLFQETEGFRLDWRTV